MHRGSDNKSILNAYIDARRAKRNSNETMKHAANAFSRFVSSQRACVLRGQRQTPTYVEREAEKKCNKNNRERANRFNIKIYISRNLSLYFSIFSPPTSRAPSAGGAHLKSAAEYFGGLFSPPKVICAPMPRPRRARQTRENMFPSKRNFVYEFMTTMSPPLGCSVAPIRAARARAPAHRCVDAVIETQLSININYLSGLKLFLETNKQCFSIIFTSFLPVFLALFIRFEFILWRARPTAQTKRKCNLEHEPERASVMTC